MLQIEQVQPLPRVDQIGGYVTVKRAADMLAITPQAVTWALRVGYLQGVELDGRTRLVRKTSVEQYARQRVRAWAR